MQVQIRESAPAETQAIADVAIAAFGNEGQEIADLIVNLLADPSAEPRLSLVAIAAGRIVGQVLFTKAQIDRAPEVPAAILAPLCVHPEFQARGIGGRLVREGLAALSAAGVGLVFVLGYPSYYPRHGFTKNAGALGFAATYSIPTEHAEAWMVRELRPGIVGKARGRIICADALDRPEYWRE